MTRWLTSNSIVITAQGTTAVAAAQTVNAVATSYLMLTARTKGLGMNERPVGFILSPARPSPGPSLFSEALTPSGLGALCGALLGAIAPAALTTTSSRRFRVT